jgi:uncharacterized protein YlzI (FlbEa/FlbD family)
MSTVAVHLILLHGLHGQLLYVNPKEVVAIRTSSHKELLIEGVKCAISTADGKFISVRETCDEVMRLIAQEVPK